MVKLARGSNKLLAARATAKRGGWLDMVRSEADERAMLGGCRFSQRRADHVCEFGPRYLELVGEFKGQEFEPLAWQRDQLLRPLFGWVRFDDEWGKWVRRYNRAYVQIPKKNGKSPLGAYVALYLLVGDGRNTWGANVYSASTDKEQAGIVHKAAAEMVRASPRLREVLECTNDNIAHHDRDGFYRVLSSCPRRNEGWNANGIVADELHKWAGFELWDALKWAFASRSEPLLFAITTAGCDLESVCYGQYQYAKDVLSGDVVDAGFFPLVYEAAHDDDPSDEATWRKANPSLGDVIKLSKFREDHDEAKALGGTSWRKFLQLRLNLWQQGAAPWLDRSKWDAGTRRRAAAGKKRIDCFSKRLQSDAAVERLPGPCWAGLDLALVQDLCALVLAFRGPQTRDAKRIYTLIPYFWLPEEVARKSKKTDWLKWADAGWLTLTPGDSTDFEAIAETILEAHDYWGIAQLIYDPKFAHSFTQSLELNYSIPRAEFQQKPAYFAEPCADFERMINERRIRHDGNPLMSWCIGNTHAVTDDDGAPLRPVKEKKHSPKKIDGTVAGIMGHAGAVRGYSGPVRFYDENEVEFL